MGALQGAGSEESFGGVRGESHFCPCTAIYVMVDFPVKKNIVITDPYASISVMSKRISTLQQIFETFLYNLRSELCSFDQLIIEQLI